MGPQRPPRRDGDRSCQQQTCTRTAGQRVENRHYSSRTHHHQRPAIPSTCAELIKPSSSTRRSNAREHCSSSISTITVSQKCGQFLTTVILSAARGEFASRVQVEGSMHLLCFAIPKA